MIDHDPTETFELVGIVARIAVSIAIANSLLFLLALRCFPELAKRLRQRSADLLGEMAFDCAPHSKLSSALLRLRRCLDPKRANDFAQPYKSTTGVAMLTRKDVSNFQMNFEKVLASNRAYDTYLAHLSCDEEALLHAPELHDGLKKYVVKVPNNGLGVRVLRNEKRVVDRLMRAAAGTIHKRCLSTRVPFSEHRDRCIASPIEIYKHKRFVTRNPQVKRCSVWRYDESNFDLESFALQKNAFGELELIRLLSKLFELLGFVHRQETVHGAILPQHVIVDPHFHSLMLVDWTQAGQIGNRFRFVPCKWNAFFPPEAISRGQSVPASDIYMATKTALFAAGFDPKSNHFPILSRPLRGLVKACLLNSPRMRPNDAWELQEDLEELIEGQCGLHTSLPKP